VPPTLPTFVPPGLIHPTVLRFLQVLGNMESARIAMKTEASPGLQGSAVPGNGRQAGK
jgi:hypothetical protein